MADAAQRAAALARNVRRLRDSHGLSLAQLAERCAIAKTTLFKIESGRANPTLDTLLALADYFSVAIGDLLGAEEISPIDIVRAHSEGIDISGTAVSAALIRSMVVGSTLVEVVDVAIHPGLWETSVSHGGGAREHVLVRRGRAIVGPVGFEVELDTGDYATYLSDRPHRWGNPGRQDALLWVIHTFPRSDQASSGGSGVPRVSRLSRSEATAASSKRK
ncbi:MAG TPA: XRE family transcriptional regulator [Solirubrobacteraceae bacterium]|nr:XRE family transcriptional regulator [Solirubrobacteraceae bacterium]